MPVGVDVGILALLAWDLLAEYVGLSWPVLRWTAWTFIAATTYLNIAAAHGNPTASIMHAAMPVPFVTVIEGIRHLIRQATGLAAGTQIEHIPASRWLLAPRSTMMLARRMVLWLINSHRNGLRFEYEHLLAVARLQQRYGRWLWRWRAPLDQRLALRLTPARSAAWPGQEPAIAADAAGHPEGGLPYGLPPAPEPMTKRDQRLVTAATNLTRAAEQQGKTISQAELGRRLRAHGLSIPNERLRWLVAAVKPNPPKSRWSNQGGRHGHARRAADRRAGSCRTRRRVQADLLPVA